MSVIDHSDILNGCYMTLWWVMPFCGVILSLALCPIVVSKLWSAHYGKICLFWALLTLIAIVDHHNLRTSICVGVEALINHFLPFAIIISTLYIVTNNICINVAVKATPGVNTAILIIGTLLANIIGTTGASMLLIRPFISINQQRRYHQHSMIFFIFLVSNIGGCLTPLGDPPLFIGFLNGITFTWLIQHMGIPLIITAVPLIILYYLIDYYLFKYKENHITIPQTSNRVIKIVGQGQFILIVAIIIIVVTNGIWTSDAIFKITDHHVVLIKDVIRDGLLLLIAVLSYKMGDCHIRQQNNFSWHPLIEISKVFAAIFITATPVIAILKAGHNGVLHSVAENVTADGKPVAHVYFWLTGLLSAFLDNAPTYLIFFNIAGGKAEQLMQEIPSVLTAISAGAVFMGSLSYIGNAPNFMVKSIAEQENIRMPGFFGYMLWSCGILIPLFMLVSAMLF